MARTLASLALLAAALPTCRPLAHASRAVCGLPTRQPLLRRPIAARCCAALPGVRINKVFTSRYSRRESDRLIASGRVTLNGEVATPGDRVLPGDTVTLDGEPFEAATAFAAAAESAAPSGDGAEPFVYLKYWKPRGVTCTTDRRVSGNIIDALGPMPIAGRLFPVGRLDKDSEGLILVTNDGRLPNSINRSERKHEKLYDVTCDKPLSDAHLRSLAKGVVITTVAQRDRGPGKPLTAPTLPCQVARTGAASFRIALTEGRNRQIRRMCEALGFRVRSLHRKSVMGITLGGLARPGQSCDLSRAERESVLRAIDEAAAGAGGGGGTGRTRRR